MTTHLLWYDPTGPIAERAIRGADACLARTGRWPAAIHAHPADLPEPLAVQVDDGKGTARSIRLDPSPRVLRSHLHLLLEAQ